MDLKNAGYAGFMDNIETAAYIAIGFDITVGVLSFLLNLCCGDLRDHFKNASGCCGLRKFKFILFTIIIGFGTPLTDTISG